MEPLRELSLFSGIGGGLLASQLLGHRILGAVDHNRYCCQVLEQRQKDGIFEQFPIFNMDIETFIGSGLCQQYHGYVDLISAGFPCQPFSTAGKQLGEADPRNKWPETLECIRQIRPRFTFLENVPSLVVCGYFNTIIADLTESGYNCRWRVLSASELGANHIRKRLWIVAYFAGDRLQRDRNIGSESRQVWYGHDDHPSLAPSGSGQSSQVSNLTGAGFEWGQGSAGAIDDVAPRRADHRGGSHGDRNASHLEGDGRGSGGLPIGTGAKKPESNGIVGDVSNPERIGRRRGRRDIEPARNQQRSDPPHQQGGQDKPGFLEQGDQVCHAPSAGLPHGANETLGAGNKRARKYKFERSNWWTVEPDVVRLVHGVPNRVERIRGLGNAQVPIVAATAWKILTEGLFE